jgi:hypothetical protein
VKYLGWVLFVITFVWAGVATYQYLELKKNPVILNVATSETRAGEGQSLGQIERVSFIRQFVERYVSFDYDNFWQGQTALSFLMTPDLREKRLNEINRVKDKIRKNAIVQKGRILSVQRTSNQDYQILAGVELSENKTLNHIDASIEMGLSAGPRSLENPWGLVVSKFKTDLQPKAKDSHFSGIFSMTKDSPTILSFPCAVENFEIPPQFPLKVKITTFNVSEIQLYLLDAGAPATFLKAYCRDKEFSLQLKNEKDKADLFLEVPESLGKSRQSLAAKKKKPENRPYQKTIENELGFVIDE